MRAILSLTLLLALALTACGDKDAPPNAKTAAETSQTAILDKAAPAEPASQSSDDSAVEPAPENTDVEEAGAADTDASKLPVFKLATASSSISAASSRFKEGVHYRRLSPVQPTSVSPGQVEVVEVFWYGCPHCFALDPKLESWRNKGKPTYAVFERIPVAWDEATRFHARLFYTAQLAGKLDELHAPIFRAIQVENNPLNTSALANAFFAAHNLSAADAQKAAFALESKLQRAESLTRRYRVASVPYFVVNGKYTLDVDSAGGEDLLLTLLNELIAREHGN